MTTDAAVISPDERVVRIEELVDGEADQAVFYAIRDVGLGYWRSNYPLDDYRAWTRDRQLRAEFFTRIAAERVLLNIHLERMGEMPLPELDDDPEFEPA